MSTVFKKQVYLGGIGFKMEKSVIVNRKDVPAYSAPGKQDGNSSRFYKKNYLVKKYFKAFNGKTYYELFDTDKQKVAGYIEDKATKERPWGFGDAHNKTQYITFMSKNYSMYKDQKFTKKGTTNSYYHKTLKAKSYYKHTNGSTYLSVYDNKNKWVGYINANALSGKMSNQIASNGVYQYVMNIALDVQRQFGGVITSGYRPGSVNELGQADDHSRRCAIDISGVSYGTYEQMKRYVVNKYKNSGLKYVIANNTWAMPSSGWGFVPYPYGGHTNHIHISCNVPSGTTTKF